jgi:DNA polymerase (family 10)
MSRTTPPPVPSNAEIAIKLEQLAQLLRHQNANRFKVKAYRSAAEAIRRSPERIGEVVARGEPVPKIRGVGASIGSAIQEIVTSGTLASIERLGETLPPGTAAIAQSAAVSVRDAQRLIKGLKLRTADELKDKLESGELREALGARLEFQVRQALEGSHRVLWEDAREHAGEIEVAIKGVRGVSRVERAGALRRGEETVGTISLVVEAASVAGIKRMLRAHGGVTSVEDDGASTVLCELASGPRLRVRVTDKHHWGDALVEETGSEAHLAEVKRDAAKKARKASATEESWYAARGLPWIAPELREGRGEVRAALDGSIPTLVELVDIRGDLHAHTTESDGASTLEEMAEAAITRGYEYLAITDHSKNLRITNGLNERRLLAQGQAIDGLNKTFKGFRLLKGSEVDILQDGSLDFADSTLRKLDWVIGSIHSRFSLDKSRQTERLLRAIKNPYLTCIGHLTGRKLLRRPGYELDIDQILRAVKEHGKLLEINSSPDRLDIDDTVALRAREFGIPLVINTDAHSITELDFMKFGVQQARRGWQSVDTIVNTLPLKDLLKALNGVRTAGK